MSLVRKLDTIAADFNARLDLYHGALPRELDALIASSTAPLRRLLGRMDRAPTQVDYCGLALTSLGRLVSQYRAAHASVDRKLGRVCPEVGALVRDALLELDGLLAEVDQRVLDPQQAKTERLELMTLPLFELEGRGRSTSILAEKPLAKLGVRVELTPARATLEWMRQLDERRLAQLRAAICAGVGPIQKAATRDVREQERAMSGRGPSARDETLARLRPRVARYQRDMRRAAVVAARRWFRRELDPAVLLQRYPLNPKVSLRRGELAFIPEVARASRSLAYELRKYSAEVDYMSGDLAKAMAKHHRRLERPLRELHQGLAVLLALIQQEAGGGGLFGLARDLLDEIPGDFGSMFSSVDEAVAGLRSSAKRLLSQTRTATRKVDDGPGHLRQARLRLRDMSDLARAGAYSSDIVSAIAELPQVQRRVEVAAVELLERYERLVEVLDDFETWARKNQKTRARGMKRAVLEDFIDELRLYVEGDFRVRHDQLVSASKAWSTLAEKAKLA